MVNPNGKLRIGVAKNFVEVVNYRVMTDINVEQIRSSWVKRQLEKVVFQLLVIISVKPFDKKTSDLL